MRRLAISYTTGTLLAALTATASAERSYPIVDTDQQICFGTTEQIAPPRVDEPFYGQDAQHKGNQPSYTDNGDGTITDDITGLLWQKGYAVLTYDEALVAADTCSTGGRSDWRLPTIKELYSLMLFSGRDVSSGDMSVLPEGATPFIDTAYFDFAYGSNGERVVDVQLLSSTHYTGVTMGGNKTVFGLNVADGRIKGYPLTDPRTGAGKLFTVRLVSGGGSYGINDFVDNGDGTVTDRATGLMWSREDSGVEGETGVRSGMSWEAALAWVQEKNRQNYLGYSDWRLPNAKELHSIVDYSRGPDSTGSAAIDSLLSITAIFNEAGERDYPWFWTSTTHAGSDGRGAHAVYLCFGRAMGYFQNRWMDVHGAGAQRSDAKDPNLSPFTARGDGYYFALSPQGDAVRLYNYVRPVRDATSTQTRRSSTSNRRGGAFVESVVSSSGELRATFSVVRSGRVSLSLYCPRGRRVVCRELGTLATGVHRAALAVGALPGGRYLVRLEGAGYERALQAVVVR